MKGSNQYEARNLKKLDAESMTKMMKELLDQHKIVTVEIDMFYGVKDTFHYGKNHMKHMVLVTGYDMGKRVFYLFETGNHGYQEYEISIDQLQKAILSATGKLNDYELGKEVEKLQYKLEFYRSNTRIINESISNMFALKNRQGATRSLFLALDEKYGIEEIDYYNQAFDQLEKAYEREEILVAKTCNEKNILEYIEGLRKRVVRLLMEESKVWDHFIQK